MPRGPLIPPFVVPHQGASVFLRKASELSPAPQEETSTAVGSRHLVQSPFRMKLWLDINTDVSCVLAALTFHLAPRFVL